MTLLTDLLDGADADDLEFQSVRLRLKPLAAGKSEAAA